MLISWPRYRVYNRFLALPEAILAPFSLSAGQAAYVTSALFSLLPEAERSKRHVPELIISPFEDKLWPDLWRIYVQFMPGYGRVSNLVQFLEDRKLKVLAAEVYEGGQDDLSQFNSFHVIVSAHDYQSPNDGRPSIRQARPFARLVDLEDSISAEFIRSLNFQDRRIPRLNIRRLARHRILAQRKKARPVLEKRIEKGSGRTRGLIFSDDDLDKLFGKETYESAFSRGLKAKTIQGGVYVMPTSDVYERFIRIVALTRETPMLFIKLVCPRGDDTFARVTDILKTKKANIVRMHTKVGLGELERDQIGLMLARQKTRSTEHIDLESKEWMRVSITFSVASNVEAELDEFIEDLQADIAAEIRPRVGFEIVSSLSQDVILPKKGDDKYDKSFGSLWLAFVDNRHCVMARIEG